MKYKLYIYIYIYIYMYMYIYIHVYVYIYICICIYIYIQAHCSIWVIITSLEKIKINEFPESTNAECKIDNKQLPTLYLAVSIFSLWLSL
jgi:hypothetical protein